MKACISLATICAGMAGLYLHIEYSGWVVFAGVLALWESV